jgi:hypothetical protein
MTQDQQIVNWTHYKMQVYIWENLIPTWESNFQKSLLINTSFIKSVFAIEQINNESLPYQADFQIYSSPNLMIQNMSHMPGIAHSLWSVLRSALKKKFLITTVSSYFQCPAQCPKDLFDFHFEIAMYFLEKRYSSSYSSGSTSRWEKCFKIVQFY